MVSSGGDRHVLVGHGVGHLALGLTGLFRSEARSEGSCPLVIRFEGREYVDVPVNASLRGHERLGALVLPGCADANESSGRGEEVDLWKL